MIQRNTIQCSLVFDAVNKLQCHATADQVYDAISQEHPHISRATVYRNLNRLSEVGRIRKITMPGGADCFDHRCDEHYHVRCERCGRVFDVDMAPVPGLDKNIREAHGFAFTGYDIVFKGLCPDCRS